MAVRSGRVPHRLARFRRHPRPPAVGGRAGDVARPCRRTRRNAARFRGLGGRRHMTALELLADLRERGVKLWVEGADLRFSAPKGALGFGATELLARHKAELVRLLDAPSEDDAPRTRGSTAPQSFSLDTN